MCRGMILSSAGLTLIWTGVCCVDSKGLAFVVVVGVMIAGALLIGASLLVNRRERRRRRAERERQTKRDTLFDNWCSYRFRSDLGSHSAVDEMRKEDEDGKEQGNKTYQTAKRADGESRADRMQLAGP